KDRFAMVVEKATELGATHVMPLITERSESVASRVRGEGRGRLERRALEALKQCGAVWVPEIADPLPLADFLTREPDGSRWLADANGGAPAAVSPLAPLTIVVGPEGGFSEQERATVLAAGFLPCRLGPNVLRFETAAVAALTTAWQARQR